jgi:hypothetical protein
MSADPTSHRHTQTGRLALFDAASDLRRLVATGTILPRPLLLQVEALVAALVEEADAHG